jgi:hypothetical protein
MHNTTIMYLAHGGEDYYRQALFSYLSLCHVAPNAGWRVLVYTDRPSWFLRVKGLLPVRMPPGLIEEWAGVGALVPRVKLMAMRDCMARFPGTNLLYLDSDTYFDMDPRPVVAQIAPSVALMNCVQKSRISLPILSRLISACGEMWDEMNLSGVPELWSHWNAGVVGLHASRRALLERVLYVADVLHQRSGLALSAQLATGIVLSSECEVRPMEDGFVHYHACRDDFRPRLREFFKGRMEWPFGPLVNDAAAFRPELLRDVPPSPLGRLAWLVERRRARAAFRLRRLRLREEWGVQIALSRSSALASDEWSASA